MGVASGTNSLLADCEPSVIHTVLNARAASTRKLYAYRWKSFCSWCVTRDIDPVQCKVSVILTFLQGLLESGKAASTLKVYVAAISPHHASVDGSSLGSHSLVCSFLKGARRLNRARSPRSPVWNLPIVLESLCQSPFEPLEEVDLRWKSLKAAFLLALASTKWVGELHALSVSQSCMRWKPEGHWGYPLAQSGFPP